MKLALGLQIGGTDFSIVLPCTVTASENGLTDNHPGIIVGEDSGIFLVACGIGRDFAILHHIFSECGVVEDNAMLAVKIFLDRIERFFDKALFKTDSGHRTPALRLDENLSLFVLMRTNLASEEIVGAEEPFAVPAVGLHSLYHLIDMALRTVGLLIISETATQLDIVLTVDDKLTGNHQRLCLRAFRFVFGGLERFVGVIGETVEIQAVVPVRTTYEGQTVRTEIVDHMVKRHFQMVEQRDFRTRLIVEGDRLGENRHVAGLLDIGDGSEDKPHRVIVETAADVVVAALCERLILVVTSAVGELGGSDVDDAFACPLGNLMDKPDEILIGVAESHPTSDTAFKEGGGAGEAEGNHALILVPDVDHAVKARVARREREASEKIVPIGTQFIESLVNLFGSVETGHHLAGTGLVDDTL